MPPQTASESEEERISWLLTLSKDERSTFYATFCGWMLDGMDVMVYSFVVPTLLALWHITQGQAGLLATAALVVSSIGGWMAGLLADRYGRVKTLQLTILWFAVFTFLSGFTNSFSQLLVVRGLQGLGFGGEWSVGSVLMAEAIGARYRGRAVGAVQSGWAIGWAIAAALYSICFSLMPPAIAWRALFWTGILPALLVFYIRKHVSEPAVYLRQVHAVGTPETKAFLEIFRPSLLRATLLASLVSLGAQGGYYAITTWLPLYLRVTRGLPVLNTTGYVLVLIAGSFSGYLVSAYLTDRWGRRADLVAFAIGSLLTVWFYTAVRFGNTWVLVLGFPLGFFSSGIFSPMGSFFAELFPTRCRASGQGFSYNFGRGLGAFFPALVGYLSSYLDLPRAIALFAIMAYLLLVVGVAFLPETKGREFLSEESSWV